MHIKEVKLSLYERYNFCIAPVPFKVKEDSAKRNASYPSNILVNLDIEFMNIYLKYIKEYAEFGEVDFGIDPKKVIKEVKKNENLLEFELLRTFENYYSSNRLFIQFVIATFG